MIRTANILTLQNQKESHTEYRKKLHEKAKKQYIKLLQELQTATKNRRKYQKESSTCEYLHQTNLLKCPKDIN